MVIYTKFTNEKCSRTIDLGFLPQKAFYPITNAIACRSARRLIAPAGCQNQKE